MAKQKRRDYGQELYLGHLVIAAAKAGYKHITQGQQKKLDKVKTKNELLSRERKLSWICITCSSVIVRAPGGTMGPTKRLYQSGSSVPENTFAQS